jgi:hypothetical protein
LGYPSTWKIVPHHNEAPATEGSRVILRDGNLITVPPSILEEEAVTTPEINGA